MRTPRERIGHLDVSALNDAEIQQRAATLAPTVTSRNGVTAAVDYHATLA